MALLEGLVACGLRVDQLPRLKCMGQEKAEQKRLFAELNLDKPVLKHVAFGNF